MNNSHLYRKELTLLCHGNPIWKPSPGTLYDCVRIGDVGYCKNDQFMPLFNILAPSRQNRRLPFPHLEPNFPELYLLVNDSDPTTQDRHPLEAGVYALESSLTFSFGIVTMVEDTRHSPNFHLIVLDRYLTENLLYHSPTRNGWRSFCRTKHVVKIHYTTDRLKSTCGSDTIVYGTLLP